MYKRILLPTDGSELSAEAERAAIAFARAHGSSLVVLAVGQPYLPLAAAESTMTVDPGEETAALKAWAARTAGRVADAARHAGVDCLLAGSVTQDVLAAATVPVMVLRPALQRQRPLQQGLPHHSET